MTAPLTVLLVDDHPLVREGIRTFLQRRADIAVVAEAGNGEQAVRLAAEHQPDVALVDLQMPGMSGAEAIRRLLEESPRTHVVVLTSHDDDESIFSAVRAGAVSYVLKEVGHVELAEAVRSAARGEPVLHPRVAARMLQEIRSPRPERSRPVDDLSPRELEVLRLVAEGLSNAEIAARLFISGKTTKNHVSSVLAKLELSDRTQAAVYAWREGLVEGS